MKSETVVEELATHPLESASAEAEVATDRWTESAKKARSRLETKSGLEVEEVVLAMRPSWLARCAETREASNDSSEAQAAR